MIFFVKQGTFMRSTFSFLLIISSLIFAGSIQAELASQLGRQFDNPLMPQSLPYGDMMPTPQKTKKAPTMMGKSFLLLDAWVEDAPTGVMLEPFLAEIKGKKVTFNMLKEQARAMTRYLRDEGFLLSQVILPPQKVKGGQVRFQVINGFIDRVTFEGDVDILNDNMKKMLRSLTQQKPLQRETLESILLLVAETPGVDIQVAFKASETTQSASDLTVTVKKDWGSALVGANNENRRELGPWQGYAGLTLNNLFDDYGRINLVAAHALDSQKSQHVGIDYETFLTDDGLKLIMDLQHNQTKPGGTLAALRSKNTYTGFKAGVKYPFILGRHERLEGELMVKSSDNETNTRSVGLVKKDHLRMLHAGLKYDVADHWGGANVLTMSMTQGISGFLGASQNQSTRKVRANSRYDFFKMNAEAVRTQTVDDNLSAIFHVQGQLGTTTLPSSQKFYFGASQTNKGYEMSVLGSDSALNGTVGLSYMLPSEFGLTRLFTNIGQGYAWVRRPTGDEKHHTSLASMDFGLDHAIQEINGVFNMVYGHPLKKRLFRQKAKQRFYVGIRFNL